MRAFSLPSVLALLSLLVACSDTSDPPGEAPPAAQGTGTTPPPSTGGNESPATPPAPVEPRKASVFVAVGHLGRSIVSCDDGVSWIHDRSDNDTGRCWVDGDPKYVECDHTPFSSPNGGVAFGGGYFYASYGWGYDGSVRRSTDGFHWEIVKTKGWGGGVAFAKDTAFTLWEGQWSRSVDQGGTWAPVTYDAMGGFDHAFPRGVGEHLFAIGRPGGSVKGAVSADGGATWVATTGLAQDTTQHIAEGNGVLVATGDGGSSSRSADGGKTWTSKKVVDGTGSWSTNLVFDGASFIAWSGNVKWTSTDGLTWASTPTPTLSSYWTAAVAYNPKTKAFVALDGGWGANYANQKAYRSTDGLTWTALDKAHFTGGHPIRSIVRGEVDPKACE